MLDFSGNQYLFKFNFSGNLIIIYFVIDLVKELICWLVLIFFMSEFDWLQDTS